jgi:hypothetical protein
MLACWLLMRLLQPFGSAGHDCEKQGGVLAVLCLMLAHAA